MKLVVEAENCQGTNDSNKKSKGNERNCTWMEAKAEEEVTCVILGSNSSRFEKKLLHVGLL